VNEIRTSPAQRPDRPERDYRAGVRRGLALLASIALVTALSVGAADPIAAKPKPSIAGVTLDGKLLSLADLRGKAGRDQRLVVLVKRVQQRGGRLRTLGSQAWHAVPLPRPEHG
jgi:hypothetical protein